MAKPHLISTSQKEEIRQRAATTSQPCFDVDPDQVIIYVQSGRGLNTYVISPGQRPEDVREDALQLMGMAYTYWRG